MSSGHSVPFYCPYCGEEDLVPYLPPEQEAAGGSGHGQWSCRSCRRAFRLNLTALAVARGSAGSAGSDGPAEFEH